MKCNVGKTDKIIRWVIGIVAIVLGVYFKNWWGAVGLIPIVTASMGFCPIYTIVGLSSCKIEEKKAK